MTERANDLRKFMLQQIPKVYIWEPDWHTVTLKRKVKIH